MDTLSGKNAVVTGAASGIGFGLVSRLVEQGMNVMLCDIDEAALAAAVDKLGAVDVRLATCRADVSSEEDIRQLASHTQEVFGDIHLVCNNAGVINGASLWDTTKDEYDWLMGVNLWGIINSIRVFVPLLKQQDSESHILNTVSMGALLALPYNGVYHMTKAAALSLSESLYHELTLEAPHVGVTALCPEFVRTNLVAADRNSPADISRSNMPIKDIVLQNLEDHITGEEAITPEKLADRAIKAMKEKRLYAISEADNPWTIAMEERFKAIRESGNPPFLVPTKDGVAG